MHVFLAFKSLLYYPTLENWYFVRVHIFCKMLCTVSYQAYPGLIK